MKKLLTLLLLVSSYAFGGTVTGQITTATSGPIINGTLTLTPTQAFVVTGTATVVSTAVSCYTDASGNVVGEPNPLVAPVVTPDTASGTLAAGTYFTRFAYQDASGTTFYSFETTTVLASTGSLIVTAPVKQPAGATGYKVFISTSSSTETLQGTITGTPGTWANYTQSVPLVSGAALPSTNTTACKPYFSDEGIPVFSYLVGLSNSSGSNVSGFPQRWRLFGGSAGTVNLSLGMPLSDGVVIYPQPIITTPAFNATQSILGGLNLNGFPLLGVSNLAITGNLTVGGGTPYFDVTSSIFNAKCDGVTDDTTAIQATIAAAKLLGGTVFIPDGKTCIVATSSSPALSFDLALHTGISCGIPNGRSRPGGGITNICALKFTGTPAIALSARGSFGIALNGLALQATNAGFTGTIVDTSHSPGDTGCGGSPCDTENFALLNSTITGVGSACTIGLSFDKTIQSFVQNSHFFGCVSQLKGASGSGSYANIDKIRDSDFNASTGVTGFIVNPGETWTISGNTFETNAASVNTLGNSGGFADTIGLEFTGNWDGDDTGAGAYTKYVLPAGTVAHFAADFISATHNNVNAFSIGNNSTVSLGGGMDYASGSTFGTMFTVGTGVSLDMAPAAYGTFSVFMSGAPSAGTVTTSTGEKRTFGNSGFNLPLANTIKAPVHSQAQTANATGAIPTVTGAAIVGDGAVDTSGAAGAGKTYGVIGTARSVNALAGDKSYAGWFKSSGFSAAAEEVGVHAETSDAAATATIFECFSNNTQKCKIDGLGNFYFTNLLISPTAPTIAAGGCGGAAASIPTNNGPSSFTVNVGTTPTSAGCVIGLPTATNGWNCSATDITTNSTSVFLQKQTAAGSSTTQVTIVNYSDVAVATAPTASDIWQVSCFAR
jgi:hypothetical protein